MGHFALYTVPSSMEPLLPDDGKEKLEQLAIDLVKKSSRLYGKIHPLTRKAISEFLRPMNSYYSNLIEGHETHPIDIERALKNDYSANKAKRELQLEAIAHINLLREIATEIPAVRQDFSPFSSSFIKSLHKRFYDHLPEDFRDVVSKEGEIKKMVPGEFRLEEVQVGRHIGPAHQALPSFMERFEQFYDPRHSRNRSQIKRIISIAASHHRLAWIHPFLDGNGRVVRLFSDACFIREQLDASGLWSISRGLARKNDEYKSRLANADMQRYNDYDGRGNLSNKMLLEFCQFFLEVAIDQVDYMYDILDIDNMLERISAFVGLMTFKHKLRPEGEYILRDVFLQGRITKSHAMRITNLSDKTLKLLVESLEEMGLLKSIKEGIHMTYHASYPVKYSPLLFPGIYPSGKEAEMYSQF